MKIYTITLLFLVFGFTGLAQEKYLENEVETQNLSKEVAQLFYDDYITVAFKKLAPYWPLPADEIESIEEKTIRYLNLLDERFGEKQSVQKLGVEKISDFALRETYVIKYEYSAIRLQFTYYKNNQGWLVNSFKWDDKFSEEFE